MWYLALDEDGVIQYLSIQGADFCYCSHLKDASWFPSKELADLVIKEYGFDFEPVFI